MAHIEKTLGYAALGVFALIFTGAVLFFTGKDERPVGKPGLQLAIRLETESATDATSRNIYQARAFTPVWLTPSGPSSDALAVMALLTHADTQGLPIARYAFNAPPPAGASDEVRAAFELRLTRAAFRYASDMQFGLLKPAMLFEDVSLPRRKNDTLANFEQATSQGNVAEYFKSLEPVVGEYGMLKTALARYRVLAARPWTNVHEGDQPGLAARLSAEGYIDGRVVEDGPKPSGETLVNALKEYQIANGLEPDGKLDDKTLAMLNVSPAVRAQQIAVNMERWRWLPREFGARFIMVNVAGASLVLVENGTATVVSRVVVGARDKPTPILATEAVAVTINPVWHVPKSIVENEIAPKLADDPDYLETKDMERTPEGGFIQHPGPQNALGTMKFEMPNGFDVYLHDTPSKRGFLSDDRALSHGCVRVERISELVQQVLQLPNLTQRIASGETSREPIKPPLPVYIQYWTVVPVKAGAIGFRSDIYGRDARMIASLYGTLPSRLASAK